MYTQTYNLLASSQATYVGGFGAPQFVNLPKCLGRFFAYLKYGLLSIVVQSELLFEA